jgi:hypothetical protein
MIGKPATNSTTGQSVYPIMMGAVQVASVTVPGNLDELDVTYLAEQFEALVKLLRAAAQDRIRDIP